MGKINAVITGVGGYVPDYILNNEELSRMVDTTDEWITTRVGIKERHILTEEGLGTSYLARKAAKQLIQKTGVDPDTIDALIVTTTTPDYKFPSTASIVLGKLGLKNAFAFDFSAACCGFLYTLDVAASMIQSGRYKKIIVIGADKMSSLVDYTDRATCALRRRCRRSSCRGYRRRECRCSELIPSYRWTRLAFPPHEGWWFCLPSFTLHRRSSSALSLSGRSYRIPLRSNRYEQRRDEDHGDEQSEG